jgi:hypothetical protein
VMGTVVVGDHDADSRRLRQTERPEGRLPERRRLRPVLAWKVCPRM